MENRRIELRYYIGNEQYIFRYHAGEEDQIFEGLKDFERRGLMGEYDSELIKRKIASSLIFDC